MAGAVNRKTVRSALKTLLESALTGSGNPLQAFYGYLVGDFQGQSPVGMLTSAGSERRVESQYSTTDVVGNGFNFDLHILALYADPGTTWSEDDMEDVVDDAEFKVAVAISDANEQNPTWHVSYRGDSVITYITISGDRYRVETIPLRVEVAR
jgi:hypothetical protein